MTRLRLPVLHVTLTVLISVLAVASLSAGKVWIPWSDWFASQDNPAWAVLFELRLPRTLLAIIVGAVLPLRSGFCPLRP